MTSQVPTRKSPTTIKQMRRRFELMAAEHVARLGSRIAARRRELGLSQNQLAELIPGKTDGNQVSKWERGHHKPGDDTLELIARALRVEVSDLLLDPTPAAVEVLADASAPVVMGDMQRIEAKLDALLAHFGVEFNLPEAGIPFGAALAHAQTRPDEQTPPKTPSVPQIVERRKKPTRRSA